MAEPKLLFPKILEWEGLKYTDNIGDHGQATKMGITLSTWKSCGYDKDGDGDIDADDVKLLTIDDVYLVFVKKFWNRCKADQINNQSIAEMLVDWTWSSGKWGIIHIQRILRLLDDGIVGDHTINAINKADQKELFNSLKSARMVFIDNVIKNDPSQGKWRHGWERRTNSYIFTE